MNTASTPDDTPGIALRERLRAAGLARGFARIGFTTAAPVIDRVSEWVARGAHASMEWLARDPARRADPTRLLPGARSVLCAAAAYPAGDARGPLAAYARGEDYHHTLRAALEDLASIVRAELPGCATRVCVDSEPLTERLLAARAGLGWIGRNTLLLDEAHGPWLLLGEILLTTELPPDVAGPERCGTCTACVDACPTMALDGLRNLDARRCLSYWNIEHRGPLPEEWAAALGPRVFGCDDCLTACPFPARSARLSAAVSAAEAATTPHGTTAPGAGEPQPPFVPRADLVAPALDELLERAEESFRRHFGSTPVERARKGGLLRNIAAVRRNAAARTPQSGMAGRASSDEAPPAPRPG